LNRELEIQPSEIIKEDFLNPRWTSDVYVDGFGNKLLKKVNFLKKIVQKIKNKLIVINVNKKLKKYFE